MNSSQTIRWSLILIISFIILSPGYLSLYIPNQKSQITIDQIDSIKPSPENIYNDIVTISAWYRYLDTSGHRAAENYIFSKFESFGLNTSRQEYTCHRQDGDVRGCNVLGLLEGAIHPDKWLIIGGHYDANQFSTHGAYDNAAGASTVIELARFFKEYYKINNGPNISILFATWDAEEGGGSGCKYFVSNAPAEIEIVANINLDMFSLNYPIQNNIPGSNEEYFKLYLYTSPVNDFSGYSNIEFNESTLENFTKFQDLLSNVTYTKNDYPPDWVLVLDDTATVSDHSHFIRKSIPAVWFRGMNEYPRNERDFNERNFKHTPLDTIETMERYAGGKDELLKGINTGLIISYQLAIGIINQFNTTTIGSDEYLEPESIDFISNICTAGWLMAIVIILILFTVLYYFKYHTNKKKIRPKN